MRASGHKTGTMAPPALPGDTSLPCKAQGQLTHTQKRDSITKHRAALKVHQKLCNRIFQAPQHKVNFQKHSWEQVIAPSYFHHQVADGCSSGAPRLQAALLHTSHEDLGANHLETAWLHTPFEHFNLKPDNRNCQGTSVEISVQFATSPTLKKCSFFRCLVAHLSFAVLMTLKGPYLWAVFDLKVQNLQKKITHLL